MNPFKYAQMIKYLTRAKKANPELPDVFPASKAPIPPKTQNVKEMEAINRFVLANPRIEKAGGGTIAGGNIQGQQIGDRTGFAKPIFLPSKNEYVVKGRDSNVVKRFKVSDYKNKQEAKKETFKFYKDFTEKNRERAKTKSIENRAKFNKAKTDYKISINKWVQNWMDNNVDNYGLRQSDKFIKDLKKDFKKEFNIDSPAKNLKSTIVDNYPNIGTAAKTGKAAFKPYGIVPILRTGREANIVKKAEAPYESLFKRAFFTKKINDNPLLKNRISKYLDYYTLKKPGGSMALDRIKAQYADTLNNLDDVMYLLSDDTGVTKGAKNNLFKNIFPQYEEFRKKQNASKISRDANIAKIEKTLGSKKLKQILNGGTSINKFLVNEGKALKKIFDVEGLDKSLRYSVDHNLGISNIAKMSKPDMEMALQSLIGTTVKRNNELGWGGYTIKSQKLIRNINEGKNVAKNLDELNKITQDAYGPELKGKNAYTIVNDKLRFTEDFTFRSNPEERFKSYFREIYQTPKGKKQIIKQAGSLKNLENKILQNIVSYSKLSECKINKAEGGRIGFANSITCIQDGLKEQKLAAQQGNKKAAQELVQVGKVATRAGLLKNILGPGALLGEAVIEGAIIGNKVLGGTPADIAYAESYLSYLDPKKYRGELDPLKMEREDMLESTADKNILRSGFAAQDQLSAFNKALQDRDLAKARGRIDQYNPAAADAREQGRFADQSADIISSEAFKDASEVAQEYLQGQAGKQQADFGIFSVPQSAQADEGRRVRAMRNISEQMPRDFLTMKTSDLLNQTQYLKSLGYDVSTRDLMAQQDMLKSIPLSKAAEIYSPEQVYGTQGKFAGGGIAKLAGVSSGVAPVRGPNPQGLLSLKNRVRNY